VNHHNIFIIFVGPYYQKTVKKKLPEYLLIPFALIYGMITTFRNKLFDWHVIASHEFDLPVICVGNITVGGTGKTPHTEYLIELLKENHRVGVLSRGYRRKTSGFVLALETSTANDVGDEPCQIKQKFPDVTVAVDEKRVRGIKKLRDMDVDVVILDDAFQHRYVKPGLSILLIDYFRPVTKDALLPFGRLRESISAIERANIILITKSPADLKAIDMRVRTKDFRLNPFQHLYFTRVKAEQPVPVFETAETFPSGNKKPGILLVTGIAGPENAFETVRAFSDDIRQMTFPDHHRYSAKDMSSIIKSFREMPGDENVIITTGKDAVKLRAFSHELADISHLVYYVPIRVAFLNNDTENFNTQIISYVRSNKRNSILHKGKSKATA